MTLPPAVPPAAGDFRAEAVTHRYAGGLALQDVTFDVRPGEIHALVGENGAGKSTLVRVLTGALVPTEGTLSLDGEPIRMRTPRDAHTHGIAVVHQDYHVFPDLTVAQNVAATTVPPPRRGPFVHRQAMVRRARDLLAMFDIRVDVARRARTLDAAERKLVEIAAALVGRPRFLILDEPTAALESSQADQLCELLERLRERGTGLVVVSHHLQDVLRLADRVTVLRDGRRVDTLVRGRFTVDGLMSAMLGTLRTADVRVGHEPGEPVLEVRDLRLRPQARPVDLSVARGEVVAVVGLIGSGTTTLLRRIGGVTAQPPARISLDGRPIRVRHVGDAIRAGIGFVSEDRTRAGIVGQRSVAENTVLAVLPSMGTLGLRRGRRIRRAAEDGRRRLDVRCASLDMPAAHLSGGNQQKVLLARWLAADVSVLLVEEPTQGVDVGARAEIHERLLDFARSGRTLVFTSSDLDEVLRLAHRVAVLHGGELAGVLDNRDGQLTQDGLLRAMSALSPPEEPSETPSESSTGGAA